MSKWTWLWGAVVKLDWQITDWRASGVYLQAHCRSCCGCKADAPPGSSGVPKGAALPVTLPPFPVSTCEQESQWVRMIGSVSHGDSYGHLPLVVE